MSAPLSGWGAFVTQCDCYFCICSANVLSVLWTSNGRQLISGDEAGRLLLWDAVSGQVHRALLSGQLPPITRIQYGTDSGQLLLSFRVGPAAVVALSSRRKDKITMLPFPGGSTRTPEDEDVIASREGEDGTRIANTDESSNSSGLKAVAQAVVGKPGLQVLIASTRGALLVLRARDLAIIDAVRVRRRWERLANVLLHPSTLSVDGARLGAYATILILYQANSSSSSLPHSDSTVPPCEQLGTGLKRVSAPSFNE